jgi:hypothetical protein
MHVKDAIECMRSNAVNPKVGSHDELELTDITFNNHKTGNSILFTGSGGFPYLVARPNILAAFNHNDLRRIVRRHGTFYQGNLLKLLLLMKVWTFMLILPTMSIN